MTSNNDLTKQLLKQEKINQLVAKDKVRVKRAKWATRITFGLWLLFLIMAVVADALEARGRRDFGSEFIAFCSGYLFLLCLLCAGVQASRTRLADKHRRQAIEARSARIDEQPKRPTKDD